MITTVPSPEQVREALQPLTMKQLEVLEGLSTVPFATLYKIKLGQTENPRLRTIGLFIPHIATALAACHG